jgi:hypothetical protein
MPDEDLFREADSIERSQDWHSVLTHELGHYAAFRIMPRAREIVRDELAH